MDGEALKAKGAVQEQMLLRKHQGKGYKVLSKQSKVMFIAAASERSSGVEPSNAAARLNGEFGEPACAGLILECGALCIRSLRS